MDCFSVCLFSFLFCFVLQEISLRFRSRVPHSAIKKAGAYVYFQLDSRKLFQDEHDVDADDVSDVTKMMRRRSRSRQQRPDGQKGEKKKKRKRSGIEYLCPAKTARKEGSKVRTRGKFKQEIL